MPRSEPPIDSPLSSDSERLPEASLLLRDVDEMKTKQLTQMQLTWIRFRRHRLAMVGSAILIFMILMAVLAPIISPENIYNPLSNDLFGAVDKAPTLSSGLRYMFGADFEGRSVTSQVIFGARFSLLIGFTSALLGTLLGVIVGATAGYFGRWIDSVLMRVVDIMLAMPFLQVTLVAAGVFGHGHTNVLLVIEIFTFFGWAYVARLVRGLFLTLRAMEYAEAARAVGVSTSRVIFRHLLPNAIRPILVALTLAVAGNIVAEAAIDFLGIGLQYPDISWGSVLAFAQDDPGGPQAAWWVTVFPGLALVLTVVAVNFVGDGLSDALDVRTRL